MVQVLLQNMSSCFKYLKFSWLSFLVFDVVSTLPCRQSMKLPQKQKKVVCSQVLQCLVDFVQKISCSEFVILFLKTLPLHLCLCSNHITAHTNIYSCLHEFPLLEIHLLPSRLDCCCLLFALGFFAQQPYQNPPTSDRLGVAWTTEMINATVQVWSFDSVEYPVQYIDYCPSGFY